MPKPCKVDYAPIIAEYQTGQYSVQDLSEKYRVKYKTLHKYLTEHKVEVSGNLKSGVEALNRGLEILKEEQEKAVSGNLSNEEREQRQNALKAGFDWLEAHHGALANMTAQIVANGIKRGRDFVEMAETPDEYAAAMRGIKTGADTLGLFPKSPIFAIQNNIQNNAMKAVQNTQIEIKVGFISAGAEKDEKSEIIDAQEVKE